MSHLLGSGPLGAALVLIMTLVACQRNGPHDPVLMYFVQDGPGAVYLVIEPNEVIRSGSQLNIRNEARALWLGGLANTDGSYTSAPFGGDVGDAVLVTASRDGVHWEVCVVVGNFGWQPETCP